MCLLTNPQTRLLPFAIMSLLFSMVKAAQGEQESLCYKPFKKATYALGLASAIGPTIRVGSKPLFVLSYSGRNAEKGTSMYQFSQIDFEFNVVGKPHFSSFPGALHCGPQGWSYMFGMRDSADPHGAVVFYDGNIKKGHLLFPVFPDDSRMLQAGSRWKMRVPPVPFVFPEHFVNPPKDCSVAHQEWLTTEECLGYKCAKIYYKIEENCLVSLTV